MDGFKIERPTLTRFLACSRLDEPEGKTIGRCLVLEVAEMDETTRQPKGVPLRVEFQSVKDLLAFIQAAANEAQNAWPNFEFGVYKVTDPPNGGPNSGGGQVH